MNISNKTKGFTLLEIVVSIAIFGIMVATFLSMFSSNFSNICLMGNKSKAVEKAQGFIEKAWEARSSDIFSRDDFKSKINECSCIDDIRIYGGKEANFFKKDNCPINGKEYEKLTVAVFYQNGKKSVVISSLIPTGGIEYHVKKR